MGTSDNAVRHALEYVPRNLEWTQDVPVEEVLAAAWRVLHLDSPADSRLAGGGVTVKRKLRVVLWLLGHPCVGLTPATQALKNIRKTEAIAYLCSVSHDHGIGIKSPSARLLALSYQSYVNSPHNTPNQE
jgi:hypothetical protein